MFLQAGHADRLVAHGFGADLGKQRRSVRLVDVPHMRHRPFDHAVDDGFGLLRIDGKKLGVLGAIGLADRLDDRLLRGEIAVERARAHAGLGADLLHRGALEAGAHETYLGGIEDALDLLVAAFRARARMLVGIARRCAFRQRYRELPWIVAAKKERTFILNLCE